MKIEIWSDIMCPFCYIGKRNLELALAKFEHSDKIEVVYKSYQLDPDYHNKNKDTVYTYLCESKKMPVEQVEGMIEHVTKSAKEAGIKMDFSKAVPGNTFDAHRLIHLAQENDKTAPMIEALFVAHFEEGKDVAAKEVLKEIGRQVGIIAEKVDQLLESDEYSYEVNQDIMESRNLGISSVPFFVFDRKYAVSGAQPVVSFEEVLEKSFAEWRKENPVFIEVNPDKGGGACTDNSCEI